MFLLMLLAGPPKMIVYRDPVERLSMLLPGSPKTEADEHAAGSLKVRSKTYIVAAGTEHYFVSKTTIRGPGSAAFVSQFNVSYETALLKSDHARKVSDARVAYGGTPARRIGFTTPKGGKGTLLLIDSPNEIDALMVRNAAGSLSPEAERFLRSLRKG